MAFFFDQLLFGAHARATSLGSWRKPVSEGTVDFDQFRGVSGEQVLAFKRLTMGPTFYHKSIEQKIYSKPI